MKAILVNYNYDPTWLKEYKDLEVTLYDRSDWAFGGSGGGSIDLTQYGQAFLTQNVGDVDYDKLGYLIEHYDNLPEVFLWGKSNIFKYVDKDFLDNALEKGEFKPLLKLDHRTYSDHLGVVCKYQGGIYEERADSWFFNNQDLANRCPNWETWAHKFHLPQTQFIPFAPGGNYILTRERVHRYGRDFYREMRDTLPYAMHPAEAHACERSYYLMWK
jgi:hypothetical protein